MGWGSSTGRGGGRKLRALLETLSSLGFEERNLGCPGILPGCPGPLAVFKKLVHRKFVRIFRSLKRAQNEEKLYKSVENPQN